MKSKNPTARTLEYDARDAERGAQRRQGNPYRAQRRAKQQARTAVLRQARWSR